MVLGTEPRVSDLRDLGPATALSPLLLFLVKVAQAGLESVTLSPQPPE